MTILKLMLAVGALSALALSAEMHTVIQKDRAFSVAEITIKPGDYLRFKNDDDVTHNVFSMSPNMQFDIRRQAPGKSSDVQFSKEGTAEVRCAIHPRMKLIVT